MRMQVCEGVILTNPVGDGRDYHAGMAIELSDEVAEDWARRGWVRPVASAPDEANAPRRRLELVEPPAQDRA